MNKTIRFVISTEGLIKKEDKETLAKLINEALF
jgi:DNA-binding protein YbaB